MHVVIMGCGRVGSTLAHSLEKRGHSVAVTSRWSVALTPANFVSPWAATILRNRKSSASASELSRIRLMGATAWVGA